MARAQLRRAATTDIPQIMRVRSAVHENKNSELDAVTGQDVAEFLQCGEMWVWEENGIILGFSAGDAQDGWIWALFVDPGHEGRGIGQALLARACGTLIRAGFDSATLTTEAGSRAARFYLRAGWTDTGRNEDGEIIFQRRLTTVSVDL